MNRERRERKARYHKRWCWRKAMEEGFGLSYPMWLEETLDAEESRNARLNLLILKHEGRQRAFSQYISDLETALEVAERNASCCQEGLLKQRDAATIESSLRWVRSVLRDAKERCLNGVKCDVSR